MRLERKRRQYVAFRKRRDLKLRVDRTKSIKSGDVLLFSTLRNERVRLPFFLDYYRKKGIERFLIVDNGSDDGSAEYLSDQQDVSLWHSKGSYAKANYGVDWLNWLLRKYGHGHWTLVVDPDEFFVYPFCDTRPIPALTDWLDTSDVRSFGAMLLDMYPSGPIDETAYQEGQNPFEIASWFDSGNYTISKNPKYHNLWIQGGPRARAFFADNPKNAPALNKTPLVRWDKNYVYTSSTHMMLPRGLNHVYDEWGGEKASGCLLHAKFLDTFKDKAAEEPERAQHYAGGLEYKAYLEGLSNSPVFWTKWSEKYINWRQLEILGLMSKGNWA